MIKWFKEIIKRIGQFFKNLFSSPKRRQNLVYKNRRTISRRLSSTGIKGELRNEIIANTGKYYRRYFIPKRSGGKREICQPSLELKKIQNAILPIIKQPSVSNFCTAYEEGKSVKINAEAHKKSKHILHIDIQNFFPSVNREMFMKTYKQLVCNNCQGENCVRCVERLWQIASLDGGLPIGAATSPFIANRIMTEIDNKLAKLDKKMTYTRYADDMIFSCKEYIDKDFIDKVESVVSEEGFKINNKKTFFMSGRKQVTGILINNGKLSLGTSYKKRLKQEIYNYLVKDEGKASVIKGKFAWLNFVEPQYAKIIKNKYAILDKKEFFNV